MEIDDPWRGVGQIGQLVVMGGEQGFRTHLGIRRQVLGDGPRDTQAIEGGGATANLVEHDEAPPRRRVQDVGCLLHLDHERRVAPRDVVRRPDAGVNSVYQWNLGLARGHERAGLRHQADEGGLPQVGRLAAHVGSGQHDELAARAVEVDVVRHERLAGGARPSFDHGMAAVGYSQLFAVVHVGLDVVIDGGVFGERRQDIERGQRARRCLDSRRFCGHRTDKCFEELELAFKNPLVSAEHFFFVFFQRRRDETLAAGDGLLAQVVGRDGVQVGFGDLDVVPEDTVVADLEGPNTCARPLSVLHLGDHLLARAADRVQFVQLSVHAVSREATIAGEGRRVVHER